MKFLIGIVILLAIYFIGYAMASPESSAAISHTLQEFEISEGVSKYISGALSLALVAWPSLAAGTFVFSEVRNLFK